MAYTRAWDETSPLDTQLANLLGQDIRNLETDIRQRIVSFGAGPIADRPVPEAVWGSANDGVMYFATDTGKMYRWNSAAWVEITTAFQAVSLTDVTSVALQNGTANTITIPAATAVVGSVITITALARSGGAPSAGSFTLDFGATTVVTLAPVSSDFNATLQARIVVTGAATQIGHGFYSLDNGVTSASPFSRTAPAQAIANAITVNLTAAGWPAGNTQQGGCLIVTVGK